jgi:Protein of unknown function (DUF2924)
MTEAEVEREIGQLADLGLGELRRLFGEYCEISAPKNLSRQLLIGAIAFGLQERAFGGLSHSAQRQMDELAKGSEVMRLRRSRTRFAIKPGTRLMREWRGRTHEVIVVGDRDYLHDGNRYGSLSEIARIITGTQWSGPRFFGLASKHG